MLAVSYEASSPLICNGPTLAGPQLMVPVLGEGENPIASAPSFWWLFGAFLLGTTAGLAAGYSLAHD